MKKLLAIILFLTSAQYVFCSNVITLPYVTSDIVYSAEKNKLYALIDAMEPEYGNSLIEINAYTGNIERSLFVGSQPMRVRLTTDENYVWISYYAIPFMKRVNLNTFSIDKEVFLGLSQQTLSYQKNSHLICYNFTVFPNENNMLAMAMQKKGIFNYEGIVLYKDGSIQPKRILPYVNTSNFPSCIEPFSNNAYLVGHRQSSSSSTFITMDVVNDGLEMLDEFEGLISTNGPLRRNNFKQHNNILHVAEGIVIDASDISSLNVLGECENDVIGDHYGFAYSEIHQAYVYPNLCNDSVYLTFYDNQTFEAYDSVFLMKYEFGTIMMVSQLEIMGSNRFAILIGRDYGTFSTRIVETREIGINESKQRAAISFYPNPASDKIFLNAEYSNYNIKMYDIMGRLVKSWETRAVGTEIALKNIQAGTYFLRFSERHNNSIDFIKKLIVK